MAWGYWTCYSYNSVQNAVANTRRNLQQNNEQLFYHNKKQPRERSTERSESRLLINSNSAGSSDNSSGKIIHNNKNSLTQENHHVEPEKVAFERRLLLGDPDWGSRTIADRNTLPRKKQPEYDKNSDAIYGSSAANSSRGRRGSSKMGGGGGNSTPPDSLSHKSQDDNFCPACAQNSNRESRVSFGSSSRDSSNRPGTSRGRSRSQDDDDYSSDARGNALSSSLPTPPPPPFCSQRDLMRHQASLLETINQKMAFLSAFKLPPHPNKQQLVAAQAAMVQASPKYNTIGPSASAYYFAENRDRDHLSQQRQPSRASGNSGLGGHQEAVHQQQQQGSGNHGHHQQTQSSRDSSAKKSRSTSSSQHHHHQQQQQQHSHHGREADKTASREHSSSSLHSLGQRQRDCDNRQTRSSNPSRRTSRSGSRTPRSSRGSRESMGSRGSRNSSRNKHCHSSKSIDLSDLHPPEEQQQHHHHDRHHHHHHHSHRRRSRSRDDEDPDEDGDAGDEAECDSDIRPISTKPNLPPKPTLVNPPVSFNDNTTVKRSESENSLHLAASVLVTPASASAAKVEQHSQWVVNNSSDLHEGSGTVRRRSRGQRSASSNNNSRPQSTGEDLLSPASAAAAASSAAAAASNSSSNIPLGAPPPPAAPSSSTNVTTVTVEANSHRSSLSQTPEDEDDLEEEGEEVEGDCESSPSRQRPSRRSSSRRSCLKEPKNSFDHPPTASASAVASTSQNSPKHFRPFDHKEAANAGLKYNLFTPPPPASVLKGGMTSEATPSRGATFYSRPRSASIGNRLSDAEPEDQIDHAGGGGGNGDRGSHHAHYHHHYRHRRHHTLDGHHHHGVGHFEELEETSFKGAASSRSISSKSEKSSNSRSSHSPSVENIRHGENSLKEGKQCRRHNFY